MVTCRYSKEAKFSWAPRGTLMGQSTCSRGGDLDSSACEKVNPGGRGLLIDTRVKSSHCAASSGFEVVSSLGVGTLTGSSSKETLSAGAGVTGFFIITSNMSKFNRSSLSRRGWGSCRAPILLYRDSLGAFWNELCTSGGPWPVPPFLSTTPLDNLEFPGTHPGEDSLFTPTHPDRAEWTTSCLFPTVWLAPWRLWLGGRPALGLQSHWRAGP